MNSNKNGILVLVALTTVFSTFAMQRNVDVKVLYNNLLKLQGTVDPTGKMEVDRAAGPLGLGRYNYQAIFDAAKRTGLIRQYTEILTSQVWTGLVEHFAAPEALSVIAFMQNTYGGGQPFEYNKDRSVPMNFKINPELGTYTTPQGTTIIITMYSFFNGLLDALVALSNDPTKQNVYFKHCYKTIVDGLSAIDREEGMAQAAMNKFRELAERAGNLMHQKNYKALIEIGSQVNPPLEKIINQSRR